MRSVGKDQVVIVDRSEPHAKRVLREKRQRAAASEEQTSSTPDDDDDQQAETRKRSKGKKSQRRKAAAEQRLAALPSAKRSGPSRLTVSCGRDSCSDPQLTLPSAEPTSSTCTRLVQSRRRFKTTGSCQANHSDGSSLSRAALPCRTRNGRSR